MRRGKALVLSAIMSLGAAQTASASGFSWNGSTICGGNNFATCAAVSVTTAYSSVTGRTLVTMTVTNLSGTNGTQAGTIYTQIGLWNLPTKNPGTAYVAGSLTVLDQNNNNVTSAWQLGTPGLNGAGIQPGVFGVDPIHGINGGLAAGDTYTFTFELTGIGSQFPLDEAGFALHGQGGYNGCSTKLVIDGDGTQNQGPYLEECTPPITSTPEPVTMTLLAGGLAGMGGANFLRRRRKQPIS
jgi:hypothetical protein